MAKKKAPRPTKGQNKSKHPTRKRKGKAIEDDYESSDRSKDNDVSWYAQNEFLLRDAGSLAYSDPAGMPVETPAQGGLQKGTLSFPGVMALNLVPTAGVADSAVDALNTAARNIQTYIREHNSGAYNYEAPNTMQYLLSMDSVYSFYSFGARAYGLIRTFAQRNRFLPEGLFFAMGLDYNDFMKKQVELRFFLNTFAERAGSLCVPASMPYMLRHMWLYQNVFSDSFIDKAQLYVYTPLAFLTYDPVGHGSGASASPALKTKQFRKDLTGTNLITVDEFISYGTDLLERIMRQEDFNIMSGDILKAFGADKIWRLIPIHEDYEVIPVFSEEVLSQIENAMAFPAFTMGQFNNEQEWIYEYVDDATSTSWLKTAYPSTSYMYSRYTGFVGNNGALLNMHKMDVSPGDNLVATRLSVTSKLDQDFSASFSNYTGSLTSCGSEILHSMVIVNRQPSDAGWYGDVLNSVLVGATATQVAKIAAFAQHPIIYFFDDLPSQPAVQEVLADLENFTFVSTNVLKRMHETAILSELGVPLMGSFSHKEG